MEPLALVLIGTGLVAIAIDLHFTQYGLLGGLGLVAAAVGLVIVLGAVWPLWLAVLFGFLLLGSAGTCGFQLLRTLRQVMRSAPADHVVNRVATVRRALAPEGQVVLDGVLWRAHSIGDPIGEGSSVLIIGRAGLTLTVAALERERAQKLRLAI